VDRQLFWSAQKKNPKAATLGFSGMSLELGVLLDWTTLY
jgi:hypothetical protein